MDMHARQQQQQQTEAGQQQPQQQQQQGACDGHHLPTVLAKVYPAVTTVQKTIPTGSSAEDILLATVKQNVINTLAEIQKRSKVVADRIKDGKLVARAAVYSLNTGEVYEVK